MINESNNKHLMAEFSVADVKAGNGVQFTTSNGLSIFAVPYHSKSQNGQELYIQTYDTQGILQKKCVIQPIATKTSITQLQLKSLKDSKVAITWAEHDKQQNESKIKLQTIDTTNCKMPSDEATIVATVNGMINQPFRMLAFPIQQTIEIISNLTKCNTTLCKQAFNSQAEKVRGVTDFFNGKLAPQWQLLPKSDSPKDGYLYIELTRRGGGTYEVAATFLGEEGNSILYKKLTNSSDNAINGYKKSLSVATGPNSFWVCTPEDYRSSAQIECLQADYQFTNLLNSTIPLVYPAASISQGDISTKISTNNNLLLLAGSCIGKNCYKFTNYLQEIESHTGKNLGKVQISSIESNQALYGNQLGHIQEQIYCTAYRQNSHWKGRCIDLESELITTSASKLYSVHEDVNLDF